MSPIVKTLILLLLFSLGGVAQQPSRSSGADLSRQVDELIRREMAARQIPGLSLAVVRDGLIVKTASYGLANVEMRSPVTEDTVFEIASNSKQFTAAGILLLARDRKLALDDSVTRFIPVLPERYRPVTLFHLLSHTSGVKDYIEEFELDRRLDYTVEQLIGRIGAQELNFPPGSDGRYSTTGYLLLGFVIEQITGRPYGEFLRERIFQPLGMKRTRVIGLRDIIPNRAAGYVVEKGLLRNGPHIAQTLRAGADIGLLTTAGDMAKWAVAMDQEGVLKRSELNAMFTPAKLGDGSPAYNDWNGHFGLGWFVDDYYGIPEINHGGTLWTGFHSNISLFPQQKLAVIVLTNRLRSDPSQIGYSVAGIYDKELRPPHRITPEADLDPQRTRTVREMLKNFEDPAQPKLSAGLAKRLNGGQKKEIGDLVRIARTFSFVRCKKVQGVTRIGAAVSDICSYRIGKGDLETYLTVYLTPAGEIADIWTYDAS